MAARIDDEYMTAEVDGRVVATAQYSFHAAADGQGTRHAGPGQRGRSQLPSIPAPRLVTSGESLAGCVLRI